MNISGHDIFARNCCALDTMPTHQIPCDWLTRPKEEIGSTAQVGVLPRVAQRKKGSKPASISDWTACLKAAGFKAQPSSPVEKVLSSAEFFLLESGVVRRCCSDLIHMLCCISMVGRGF